MTKFNINTAMFVMGMWTDEEGNRISENEYNKILSASTWGEIDPDLLDLDDPGQIPYDDVIGDRDHDSDRGYRADYMHPAQMEAAMDALGLNFYPEDMTFAEYVSGIKF